MNLKDLIRFPVYCDDMAHYIFDADNNMVMQVRGWGRLSKHGTEEEAMAQQKFIGDAFAEALNKANGY
jgi:hypothetical protein